MRALIVCITLLFAFLTCTMAQIPSVKVENTKGAQVNTSSLINHKTPMIISFGQQPVNLVFVNWTP